MTDGPIARLREAAFRPVDLASLAAFRVLFGLMMAFGAVRFLATGWMRAQYVEPVFFFKYPGFAWVQVWPEWGLWLHFSLLAVLALLVAIGWRTRICAALFFLAFTYVQLMDVTNYLNHYWLVVALSFLVCFLPLEGMFSLDARRDPRLARTHVPAWMLWLMRFQVGAVYVHAGLAKLETDWILHGQPLGIWMAARDGLPAIGPLLALPGIGMAMSWAGLFYDTTIVGWLMWRRTRPLAFATVVFFHVLTRVLFDIGMFPAIMIVSATLFFDADWPRRWVRLMPVPPPVRVPALRNRLAMIAIACWVVFHAAFPLRHLLYPGTVLWNEEGMRFAWKVMLREKSGSVTYRVRDVESGREWSVTPMRYLTWRQAREMSGQPDLIAQLAREIGADFARRGHANVEVRADALVSLNGRAAAPLIDPTVDLLTVRSGLSRKNWVLPAPTEPPIARPGIAAARR